MDIVSVIILSAVEGLTEFLPVSSTGHLMIASRMLSLPPSDVLSSFQIFIQLGAIMAVLFLYFDRLAHHKKIVLKVAAAFLPTAVIGLALYPVIKHFLLESLAVVAGALFVGGIFIILFESWYARKKEDAVCSLEELTYFQAIIVGVFQSLAVIPGVSRAGATIIGGLYLGLSRSAIVEFSFLLAIPTMAGAVGLDLLKTGPSLAGEDLVFLLLGFVLSFIFALGAIRWLISFIKDHDFHWFGIYRIVAAIFIWVFLL